MVKQFTGQRLVIMPVVTCLALNVAINALPSISSDRSQCHDLPAKQTVLDQGQQLLESLPTSSPVDRRYRTLPSESNYYEFFDKPDANIQNKCVLQNTENLSKAREIALNLERYSRFRDANFLYNRILSDVTFPNLNERDKALAYEGAARSKIEMENKSAQFSNADIDEQLRDARTFRMMLGFSYVLRLRDISVEALAKAQLSDIDLQSVKKLFKSAYDIRAHYAPNEDFITDLMMLGAICERTNDLSQALSYASRAQSLMAHKSGGETRNEPDAFNVSGQPHSPKGLTSESSEPVIVSSLIRLHLKGGHTDEAIKLFKIHCLQKSKPVHISGTSLIAITSALPAEDRTELITYTYNLINQDLLSDRDFRALVQEMKARGWGTECNTIANQLFGASVPSRLLMAAYCYADSKDDRSLTATTGSLLRAVRGEPDEEALTHLKQMQQVLSSFSKSHPEEKVTRELEQAINTREDMIRRRTCLQMATKLNETAFALEKKAQPAMAAKLYKEALEIKQKNLTSNDPETASQLVDLARSEASQQHYDTAQLHYEKALGMLRRNKEIDPSTLISALESYGMMLNDWHHEAKATAIYDEAKDVYNRSRNASASQSR